jgi:DNA-binding NarL/FixJ family response regulator
MQVSPIGPKTSVSVLSDSRLFRETISAWLRRHEDIECVVAASIEHLRRRLEAREAEVLLVRARIDGLLGRELAYEMRTLLPATRLIVMQSHVAQSHYGEHDLAGWIEAGAVDYLHQNASPAELLQSIRDAARGCPRCSMSRYLRVIGPSGEITYKAAYLGAAYIGDSSVAAEPVVVRDLDQALRQQSGLANRATAGPRGIKTARSYDLSRIPVQ